MAGRITFSEENVKKNEYDFPKLKLKKNEIARIVLLEDPVAAYVHDLREPKLVNGIPEMTVKERRDGTTYEDYRYNFVSRPICLGDEGTIADIGSDPINCPICAEAKTSDRASAPKRRFAMHVIKYATKPGSADIQTPYSVQTLLWSFTDKVFGKIVGFMQEWGDLRTHDLILKCDNEVFQNYEISIAAKAAWMEDTERADHTKATFKENQTPDLEIFCGTKKEAKYIEMDLNQIRAAYAIATGTPTSAQDAAMAGLGAVNLEVGLASLLDSTPAPAAAPVAAQAGNTAVMTSAPSDTPYPATPYVEEPGSLASSLPAEAAPTAPVAAPVATPAPAAAAPVAAPAADSFEDLLAGL